MQQDHPILSTPITPEDYRPLLRVGRILATGGGVIAGLAVAADELTLALVHAILGLIGFTWWIIGSGFTIGYRACARRQLLTDASDSGGAAPSPQAVSPDLWEGVPAASGENGYLYVIKFGNGVVKVGQTADPRRRLGEHRSKAWAYGVVITDAWLSAQHAGYVANEAALLAEVGETFDGQLARREYFHGADFRRVVKAAERLVA